MNKIIPLVVFSIFFTVIGSSILVFAAGDNLVVSNIGSSGLVGPGEASVPLWIKTTMGYWVDGHVTDTEFLNAIEFLANENIIEVAQPISSMRDMQSTEDPATSPFTCDGVACDCNDRADCWDLMLSDSCSDELFCDGNENCSCWQASKGGYDNSKWFQVESFSFGIGPSATSPFTCDGVACDCNGEDNCWDLMLSDSCSDDLSCDEGGNCSCLQASSIAVEKDQVNSDGDVDGLDFLIWQSHFGESVINDGQLIANQKVEQLVPDGIVGSETWQSIMSDAKQEINSAHMSNYEYPGLYSDKGIVDDLQVIVLFNNALEIEGKLVQLEINHLRELTDRVEKVTDEDMKRLDLLKQKLGSIQEGTAYLKYKLPNLMIPSVTVSGSTSDFELKTIDVSTMSRDLQELSDLMDSKQVSTKITSNYQR